ncbi:putative drug exporter of the RND superfamily [Quadrisphaera granulorum]|uniref:RND superfamily putative drug exporter n=1 Tax=Quadrisphaera granulorum TaxID=317664 RepID=A0A315ZPZ9_9ACTN|nr:MMPL family transporter [Quadrisphaera granulorum]PWJ46978.1 RND superfamily putative drug exporter [Quadrisphaera granulorum]SZE98974.1 putative drug exporter of the RND superfamily [Quadrisphaera granulorum]
MLVRLARTVVRLRRTTLVAVVLGVLLAGGIGASALSRLQSQGFDDPGSESARAATALRDDFGVTDPDVVLAVQSAAPGTSAVDPSTAAAATALVDRIAAEPGVDSVVSYWTSGRPPALLSTDGRAGQVLVHTDPGASPSTTEALGERVLDDYAGSRDGLQVYAGGRAVVGHAISSTIASDLALAEGIAVPVTTALLVVVFGGLAAALLPFLVAAVAVAGSLLVLFLATLTTDVSVFALNLTTGLGLGLGIDYALLVVNRFREELARSGLAHTALTREDVDGAVVRTVASAGRTVLVSGATVAATMASLLLFPQYFLRSFGIAGVASTSLAVVGSLVALPALLSLLGPRVDALRVVRRDLTPRDTGAWASAARAVMRRPWPVLVGVLALLAVLAAPARDVVLSQTDARVLPASSAAAVGAAFLDERFAGAESSPLDVVVPGGADSSRVPGAELADYAAALSRVEGVVRVVTPTSVLVDGVAAPADPGSGWTTGSDARLAVITDSSSRTPAAIDLVDAVRAVPSPAGTLVGGGLAVFADGQHATSRTLPAVLAWVALTTLVVLFLFTGSVLLPVKAVLMNLVSLGAVLGVLVWVFQEGHLRQLVGGFTVTGTVDTAMLVLVAVVAFALSMDYEVFLLARIKELHDAGASTEDAVVLGLQRSGRIITAAALLLAIVFSAFVTSGVTSIKQLGLGVGLAVLLDATLVRGLLVPAFMRLAGRANWWAPKPLRLVHARLGLREA